MQVTEKLTPEAWIHQPCETSLHLMLALRWSRMLQKQSFLGCKATGAAPPESTPKTSHEVRGGEEPHSGAPSRRWRPRPQPLARLPLPHLSCWTGQDGHTAPPTRPGASPTRGDPHPLSCSSFPPPRHLIPPHHPHSTLWRGLLCLPVGQPTEGT